MMPLSEKEKKIYNSIKVSAQIDPFIPTFPPENPSFPATPTFEIDVPGFKKVLLKDESVNPTGTHKDRMAWAIVNIYKQFLEAKKREQTNKPLPKLSIITSGTAAAAIQTMLKKYNLPNLKALIDKETSEEKKQALRKIGCEIYETDLGLRALDWRDVLRITDNYDGFDITSNEAFGPTIHFYDWMAYEIINQSPDYCFIPYGSGTLYENILNIAQRQAVLKLNDPRFTGDVKKVRNCDFFGATTNDATSKADGLYSPHRPFAHYDEQWIRTYRRLGACGQNSQVCLIKESYLDKALEVAEKNKVTTSPSGIAGLALLLNMESKINKDKKILVVNTGKNKLF